MLFHNEKLDNIILWPADNTAGKYYDYKVLQ